ncbi:MAG: hypothetical protein WBG08_01225 [Litorimonas sp.]
MPRSVRPFRLSAAALIALPLCACGVRGQLQTPAPLWGPESVAEVQGDDRIVDVQDPLANPLEDPLTSRRDGVDDSQDDLGYGVDVTRDP